MADNPVLPEAEVVVEEVAPPFVLNDLTGPVLIEVEDITIVEHGWLEDNITKIHPRQSITHDRELEGAPNNIDDRTDIRRR